MKPLIIAAIASGLVIILWITGRITAALQFFSVTTSTNQPTLRPGGFFFTSDLLKPRRLNFICYRVVTPENGHGIWTHRLCGLPGDTIEIKQGVLFVNGQDEDRHLSLIHMYKMEKKNTTGIGIVYDRSLSYTLPPYPDIVYAPLEDRYVSRYNLPCERHIIPPGVRDETIFRIYKKNWNRDNFGPVRVPPGKFFVLADNRENTQDSRYMGFLALSKFVGTVLWK